MNISVIDYDSWENLLKKSPYVSPFHHFAWGQLIHEQFSATFVPLLLEDNTHSWLAPCYLGLPWSKPTAVTVGSIGYGGPIALQHITNVDYELRKTKELITDIRTFTYTSQASAILYPAETWSAKPVLSHVTYHSTSKVLLAKSKELTFENILSGNARTAVRKSQKLNITIREINLDSKEERLRALTILQNTQNAVGSGYVTSESLFNALLNLRAKELKSKLFVAIYEDRVIAMTLAVYDSSELFHLFHGWERDFAYTCANQALIWHMMCYSIENNIRVFNMGESHTPALLAAKERWGSVQQFIPKISL